MPRVCICSQLSCVCILDSRVVCQFVKLLPLRNVVVPRFVIFVAILELLSDERKKIMGRDELLCLLCRRYSGPVVQQNYVCTCMS